MLSTFLLLFLFHVFFFFYLSMFLLFVLFYFSRFIMFLILLFLKFLHFWHVHFLSLVSFLCRRQRSIFLVSPAKDRKKIFSRFFFFIFLFSVRPSYLSFVSLSPGNHVVKSQFFRPSICPSVRLSVYLSVRLLVFLSVSVCVYVRPSVCLSVCPPARR